MEEQDFTNVKDKLEPQTKWTEGDFSKKPIRFKFLAASCHLAATWINRIISRYVD
jgi:hypothetical protein